MSKQSRWKWHQSNVNTSSSHKGAENQVGLDKSYVSPVSAQHLLDI